jgi:thioredoxin reductase (NADPH)
MRFCIGNVSTDFELRMNINYQTMTRKVESGQRLLAIGDVRASSTKRVAAAVGDGAAVVSQIHEALKALP